MRVLFLRKAALIRTLVIVFVLAGAILYARALVSPTDKSGEAAETGAILGGEARKVALTFDTAFGEDQTEILLEVLNDKNTPATFAVMGAWLEENPQLTEQISQQGHQIISHSMTHGRYPDLKDEEILRDAEAARTAIALQVGEDTSWIRPPYGAVDDRVKEILSHNGYRIITWDLDSQDWKGEDGETVANRVLKQIKPGDVVVFQNNVPQTAEALPRIIEELKNMNYQMVTLDQIYGDSKEEGSQQTQQSEGGTTF